MTVGEVEALITSRLKGPFLVEPKVTVSITEYRHIFVNGEVVRPGGYPFVPGLSVRKAISIAGGLKEGTAVKEVHIVPESDPNGAPRLSRLDARVQPGDIIIVKQSFVFVNGEVANPGSYPYQSGLTVRKVISLAGGFKDRASRTKIWIIDEGRDESERAQVNLDVLMKPGDILTIDRSFF